VTPADDRSRGSAVALVLLITLAFTALGHAAFLVALSQQSASRASVAVLQARLMAEAGTRRALREALADSLPSSAAGALIAEGRGSSGGYRVELRRLTAEIYRLDAAGTAALARGGPQRVQDRVARLLWSLSPVARLRDFEAVVEHGEGLELGTGSLITDQLAERGALDSPAGCQDLGASLDSILVGRSFADVALRLAPAVKPLPELGLLAHDSLLARTTLRVGGMVTPTPTVVDGRCAPDASNNWGSPLDPAGPCGGFRPALGSEGALTMLGGEGQGLLVVAGDLRLTAGARFDGLVLVGGNLTVDAASELSGLARVRGRVRMDAGGKISASVCRALLALRAAPLLRRPVHVPGGGWLRPA
jgi:hypothetical protein